MLEKLLKVMVEDEVFNLNEDFKDGNVDIYEVFRYLEDIVYIKVTALQREELILLKDLKDTSIILDYIVNTYLDIVKLPKTEKNILLIKKIAGKIESLANLKNLELEEVVEKVNISWDSIQTHMDQFIEYDKARTKSDKMDGIVGFDTILCLTRGGLIPAGMLSYKYNVKNIINLNISSYNDDNKQGQIKLEALSERDILKLRNSKKFVIVDDIIDSGNTINATISYLLENDISYYDKGKVFSIVDKQQKDGRESLYDFSNDKRWIVWPWDA